MERYNFKVIEKKWQNYWEQNQSFKADLDKGIQKSKGDANVYMDIGANIGWYSLCAIKAGYTSVVSIEANPDTFSSLRNNIKINKFDSKITALNLAISNEQKILGITDSTSSDQNTILSSDPDTIKVFSMTVDDLITHLSINEKIYLKWKIFIIRVSKPIESMAFIAVNRK